MPGRGIEGRWAGLRQVRSLGSGRKLTVQWVGQPPIDTPSRRQLNGIYHTCYALIERRGAVGSHDVVSNGLPLEVDMRRV